MYLDVDNLYKFYTKTGLGHIVQNVISSAVREFWPDTAGKSLVGYGFVAPIIWSLETEVERLTLLMPGQQGVIYWPNNFDNISVLCEENLWPLPSGTTDRIVFLHSLEFSENMSALFNECWRVLSPGGKVLFIVPNRTGLWCRSELTPFGSGRAYTLSQLESQLLKHSFTPKRSFSALFSVPSNKKIWLKSASLLETIGKFIFPIQAGGIIILEATKQVPASKRISNKLKIRVPFRAMGNQPITPKYSAMLTKKIKLNSKE